MERGTEDLNSVGSDSRPPIDSFLYLGNVSVGRNKRERQIGGLIITPPAPRATPTEHSKKKPTCGSNFSVLLSGFYPTYNTSKIAIHTNRNIVTS
ncbi:hypothetical protein N7519_009721 [Penicillium mononematosum]|uniref:uncharacterized protein n=1 Tax=Penicillium mononematosum TaxID=268346 RepID=UPI0025475694|nr:uncharacterized protein N7519_009721 [Penicillium mononematosum]KAJ6179260.1 hypothetical protein N7519_009721 [Penicillium mononematosum]